MSPDHTGAAGADRILEYLGTVTEPLTRMHEEERDSICREVPSAAAAPGRSPTALTSAGAHRGRARTIHWCPFQTRVPRLRDRR